MQNNPFELITDDEVLYQMCKEWNNETLLNMSQAYKRVNIVCQSIITDRRIRKDMQILMRRKYTCSNLTLPDTDVLIIFGNNGNVFQLEQIIMGEAVQNLEARKDIAWIIPNENPNYSESFVKSSSYRDLLTDRFKYTNEHIYRRISVNIPINQLSEILQNMIKLGYSTLKNC